MTKNNDPQHDTEPESTTPDNASSPSGPAPGPEPTPDAASAGGPPPPEEDKFLKFTKRFAASAERAIGSSYKKARTAVENSRFESRAGVRVLDDLLDWCRRTFPADIFESLASWLVKYGHAAMVCAQVLTVLFGLTAAIKLGNWILFLYGIGVAILLIILQFTASRFLNAGDALIKSSPSRLRSEAFPDCVSLLAEVLGILLFLSYIVYSRQTGQWSLVWVGLGAFALFDTIGYIALHPSLTNVTVDGTVRAGEEAIGIMSFAVKIVVRIVPIAFGIGTLLGAIGLLFATFSLMRSGLMTAGRESIKLVAFCACLPFASYVFFAFYHLLIDVLRAILEIPAKLDGMNRGSGE